MSMYLSFAWNAPWLYKAKRTRATARVARTLLRINLPYPVQGTGDPRGRPGSANPIFIMSHCILHHIQGQLAIPDINVDCIAVLYASFEDGAGNSILYFSLDDTLERARSILWIVAHISQHGPGLIAQMQGDMSLRQARAQ